MGAWYFDSSDVERFKLYFQKTKTRESFLFRSSTYSLHEMSAVMVSLVSFIHKRIVITRSASGLTCDI